MMQNTNNFPRTQNNDTQLR